MTNEKVIIQGEVGKILYIILIGGVDVYMENQNITDYNNNK